eukprot:1030110-Prymnesium_polylepis.1
MRNVHDPFSQTLRSPHFRLHILAPRLFLTCRSLQLCSHGLTDHQIAVFFTRVDQLSAPSMMELLTLNQFTAGSYAQPYLPHLFNVPALEAELLSYAEFQPSAAPPPTPSGPGSATPLAAGSRDAVHGAVRDLGNSSAAPLASLLGQPFVAEARVPGGVASFGTAATGAALPGRCS